MKYVGSDYDKEEKKEKAALKRRMLKRLKEEAIKRIKESNKK